MTSGTARATYPPGTPTQPVTNLVMALLATDSTSPPRGVLFLSVATVLALMGTPALAVKPLVGTLVMVAAAHYAANGLYDVTGVTGWQVASAIGGLGIVALAGLPRAGPGAGGHPPPHRAAHRAAG